MIEKKCKKCGNIFKTYPSRIKVGKGIFCSVSCYDVFQKGKKPWNTGKKSKILSLSKTGIKNPNWKGGVSKKDGDKKYSLTPRGIETHNKARKKWLSKEENKEKVRAYIRRLMKENIHYKIKRNISNGVWYKLVRYRGSKKDSHIKDCLPYTINELKSHLEKLFLPDMSWDNYGKWHIDHKIPDCSFQYSSTKDDGFKKSWALQNLQPMWGADNIKKGRKIL